MWYSNEDGKKERSFYWENREYFDDLELYDLTDSTVAYILSVKESLVWKWRTGQTPIPPKHRKKLENLIQSLRY